MMGAGAGQGRGGTCVFLHKNVRRNRLECRFGAEYRGENQVFFTRFFQGVTGYFPCFTGFFRGKNPAPLKNPANSRGVLLSDFWQCCLVVYHDGAKEDMHESSAISDTCGGPAPIAGHLGETLGSTLQNTAGTSLVGPGPSTATGHC